MHYNYFRDYDPRTGRYVQSDPIGVMEHYRDPSLQIAIDHNALDKKDKTEQTLNHVYGYVNMNPMNSSDYFGLVAGGPGPGVGPPSTVCGPSQNPGLASLIPDGIWKRACAQHDRCYGTCGKTKEECDLAFLKASGNFVYYITVVTTAGSAYRDAQAAAGCDDCEK